MWLDWPCDVNFAEHCNRKEQLSSLCFAHDQYNIQHIDRIYAASQLPCCTHTVCGKRPDQCYPRSDLCQHACQRPESAVPFPMCGGHIAEKNFGNNAATDEEIVETLVESKLACFLKLENELADEKVNADGSQTGYLELNSNCSFSVTDDLIRLLENPDEAFDLFLLKLVIMGVTERMWGIKDAVEKDFEEKRKYLFGVQDINHADSLLSRFGAGCACWKGRKRNQPNQDSYCFGRMEHFTICGVADGHGAQGHWVSHWVVRCVLYLVLIALQKFNALPCDALFARIFSVAHEVLKLRSDQGRLNIRMSGCTLSLCVIDHTSKTAVIAWVGDSRCMVSTSPGEGIAHATIDHTPAIARERDRILRNGGDVVRLPGDVLRVFKRGRQDAPGLAMSRALGDTIAQGVGVIHAPDIMRCRIDSEQFALLCTDGVWGYIDEAEAIELVMRYGRIGAQEAAAALVAQAKDRWLRAGRYTDDMTALVVWP